MARRPWYVVLGTAQGTRRSSVLQVVDACPPPGVDDVAAFEVRGVRKGEAVATVLRWLVLGRPRIMLVTQVWGHAATARSEASAALDQWQDQEPDVAVSAGEALALVVRRYVASEG